MERVWRGGWVLVLVLPVCTLLAACLDGGDSLVGLEPEDCIRPAVDTTGWVRTTGSVNIQLPPGFEEIGDQRWERGGTRVALHVVPTGEEPVVPFPEWNYLATCRATSNGRRFVIDYGAISSGGPSPDLGIAAAWRSVPLVGGSGDVILSAQARDHSDSQIVEEAIWTIVIRSGPGGL